ncbi:MAG: phenylalanine--tRNA ligase subunit beta, partial [Bryobacteraceae bacterium]
IEATVAPLDRQRVYHRELREKITDFGFTEVYNYSFVSEEIVAPFGFVLGDHVHVLNPIASDQAMLRTSLLPGIRKNILDNSRYFHSFRLFEIGREYHKRSGGLPEEIPHLVAAIYSRGDGADGLFELKGVAEALLENCETKPTQARAFEHPHRAAEITLNGQVTGRLFELHPSLIAEGRAAVLDLDLAVTLRLQQSAKRYKPLRRFPASSFDLSVVTGDREHADEVSKQLAALAGDLLIEIEYLRQFDLGENRKSLSYRLTFGAPDRTLSSDEVNSARSALIEGMRSRGYELRV